MAVVKRSTNGQVTILWRAIVSPDQVVAESKAQFQEHPYSMCVIGSGTRSNPVVQALAEAWPQMGVVIINEQDSTLMARQLYWETKGRRGWRKLLPASLQVPPEEIDDFAAVVIANRFLDPEV
jgi:hypothetical protein